MRGAAYAICGATLGATLAFALGRALGRDGVRRILGARAPRLEVAVDETRFLALLILRLLPVVPFNGLNYAAGVTGIRTRAYVAATLLGIAPGTAAVATAGGSIDQPRSPAFIGSAAVGGLLLVTSLAVAWRRRRHAEPAEVEG